MTFQVKLIGDENETYEVLCLILKLAFLYDGDFYKLKRYMVDGRESEVVELFFILLWVWKSWREEDTTMAGSDKDIYIGNKE